MPTLSIVASQKGVILNPNTVLAGVATSGCPYFPSTGRLALRCSIIPLSVIKRSQRELRWSEKGEELRLGVHVSHKAFLTGRICGFP